MNVIDNCNNGDISGYELVFHQKNSKSPPLLTVGLPTYNRPEMIQRTLDSLATQSFRDFVVIVSDNAGSNAKTLNAVQEYASKLPEICLLAQTNNIGPVPNFKFLLSYANTKYFMWLADDDQISSDYLQNLVSLLEQDEKAVSAMGQWIMVRDEVPENPEKQLKNTSNNIIWRLMKYIILPSDDSFFYAVHRTENLKKCRFETFFYPNKSVLTGHCYVYLYDLLLQGPVRYTDKSQWICHSPNTSKNYKEAAGSGINAKLATIIRKLNIYSLYCMKTARKRPLLLLFVIPASIIGFIREVIEFSFKRIYRKSEN